MNPVLNVKWMNATLVIEEFAMVYVNLGYFSPLVFWYQLDWPCGTDCHGMFGYSHVKNGMFYIDIFSCYFK